MTTLDEPIVAETVEEPALTGAARYWQRFEDWLARMSDHLNPILVKEARQALRSRQFTITFFLMLIAGWTWSIMGLALLGPAAYYSAEGARMFFVYYMILAAPLVIVIPFSAYSSLASERQDRTHELVSITALDATRILTGKLSAAGLQMIIYLSALFPCLAFTYLLRGLDILTVLVAVAYASLLSLGMVMLGLLLAALAPSRQLQLLQGVAFAAGLCGLLFFLLAVMSELVELRGSPLGDPEFWMANFALGLFYVSLFALVFLAARAQLTMASQNRSTALRVALFLVQCVAIGWIGWASQAIEEDIILAMIFLATAAWFACGMFIVGEPSTLSPRVRRDLPRGAFGRLLATWLMPGPATGYMFVLINMIVVAIMAVAMTSSDYHNLARDLAGPPRSAWSPPSNVPVAALLAVSYIALYLGLGRLVLGAVGRFGESRLTIRFLVNVLLVMLGGGLPWVVQISNPTTRDLDYTLLQISNPVWTLWEYCVRNGVTSSIENWLITVLPLAALLVWGANLPSLIAELRQTRVAKPERIAEDDAALRQLAVSPTGSPWDN